MDIDNLFVLHLVDGIPTEQAGKQLRYRVVHLRETTVADERRALRLAERVVSVAGQPKLLASDADFQYALTMCHIAKLECDGQTIGAELIDLDLFGKLSPHDLGLIEQRVFLLNLAAEVRYGLMSQADFDAVLAGQKPAGAAAPQPLGQAAELGAPGAQPEPGPALLTDYLGNDAHGAAARPSR